MAGFRTLIQILKGGAFLVLLAACLFGASRAFGAAAVVGLVAREVQAICRDAGTQWMVFVCAGVYFVTFALLLQRRLGERFFAWANTALWLSGLLVFAGFAYALDYSVASQSMQPLVLVSGAALGLGFGVWVSWGVRPKSGTGFQPVTGQQAGCLSHLGESRWQIGFVLVSFVVLLTAAALWKADGAMTFRYRGEARWSGPWDNPNEYGVLMGVGFVLACGCALASSKFQIPSSKHRRWLPMLGCAAALAMTGIGLFKSYSRGAWLGAVCGLGYLVWQWVDHRTHERHEREHESMSRAGLGQSKETELSERRARSDAPYLESHSNPSCFSCGSCVLWFHRNWFPLAIALASLFVVAFWSLRHTEFAPVRRLFSAGNVNDFSWRNRVDAWEGSLQMMADKPWLGWGWNRPEQIYDNFYRAARLEEGMAIQLNDYFTLGMAVGVPALVCLIVFVWLALSRRTTVKSTDGDRQDAGPPLKRMQAICRVGAIVLLVGFWFDGGLFELHLAAPFWILLSLGALRLPSNSVTSELALNQIRD